MKTVFIPVIDKTALPAFTKLLPLIKNFKCLSITSTVQFHHRLDVLESFLKSKGRIVHACNPVLGCRSIISRGDAVIIITTGVFHALNIGVATNNPVIIINPHDKSIKLLDKSLINSLLKKRAVRVSKVIHSRNFGILVSKKQGQSDFSLAKKIQAVLESHDKTAVILVADELSPLNVNNFTEFDAFINTACPRLVEDDFEKPVVNWVDVSSYFELQ